MILKCALNAKHLSTLITFAKRFNQIKSFTTENMVKIILQSKKAAGRFKPFAKFKIHFPATTYKIASIERVKKDAVLMFLRIRSITLH